MSARCPFPSSPRSAATPCAARFLAVGTAPSSLPRSHSLALVAFLCASTPARTPAQLLLPLSRDPGAAGPPGSSFADDAPIPHGLVREYKDEGALARPLRLTAGPALVRRTRTKAEAGSVPEVDEATSYGEIAAGSPSSRPPWLRSPARPDRCPVPAVRQPPGSVPRLQFFTDRILL